MAYTPTEWKCGDSITVEKMNKIERGIADASSGGAVEVEVIKIASVNGGGNQLAKYINETEPVSSAQAWTLNGGGTLLDRKSLKTLLDGKTMLSLVFDISGSTNVGVIDAWVHFNTSSRDILLDQFDAEKTDTLTNITIHAIGYGNSVPNGSTIDIYAICI